MYSIRSNRMRRQNAYLRHNSQFEAQILLFLRHKQIVAPSEMPCMFYLIRCINIIHSIDHELTSSKRTSQRPRIIAFARNRRSRSNAHRLCVVCRVPAASHRTNAGFCVFLRRFIRTRSQNMHTHGDAPESEASTSSVVWRFMCLCVCDPLSRGARCVLRRLF